MHYAKKIEILKIAMITATADIETYLSGEWAKDSRVLLAMMRRCFLSALKEINQTSLYCINTGKALCELPDGTEYWYFYRNGVIEKSVWDSTLGGEYRLLDNCFQTKEDAERALKEVLKHDNVKDKQ